MVGDVSSYIVSSEKEYESDHFHFEYLFILKNERCFEGTP